eukprot:3612405-Alexandrium_andersonii.AAC.1
MPAEHRIVIPWPMESGPSEQGIEVAIDRLIVRCDLIHERLSALEEAGRARPACPPPLLSASEPSARETRADV